jgi:uncharacterized protein YerC
MRTSGQKLNPSLKRQIKMTLAQAICDMSSSQEIDKFLQDFLTDAEYVTFAKRLAIAYWLKKGRSYENIRQNLKVSSATIASSQQEMKKEGIKFALEKIEAEEWANKWAEKIKKFVGR